MHCSSDIETLMNDGICFNDCFSQEYVKYVNMWNFPWMGGGGGGNFPLQDITRKGRYISSHPL